MEPREMSQLSGRRHSRTWVFAGMLFSALISLTASLVLSIDAVKLAGDPGTELACDINSVLSCGSVALSWQAQLLGFPNAFLGLIAEPVVITIAVAGLGGVQFPRWFMAAAQGVYTIGLLFAYWLFAQSYFVIHALCPWCLLVTLSTTVVFMTLLHWNVMQDNLYLPRRVQRWAVSMIRIDADVYLTAAWIVLLVAAVLLRYGNALLG
ncbi:MULTISPECIES: vitamin K epoxide reductase family protein [Isoptericola]|uniref:Vitamin K epoxide reductase family protein n=1 Tax=Isoptericola sediminis TaxID=2733572 RepID=A0A849KDR6_9MICO|nr:MULTISPECIES: vitamin K epoxide reductase family protein [Isoptericola]MDO8145825.1 vitamin K epoxide reductase family protein [Isoptericola sp. 178]MDO8147834.1 vitamin K epoxide reductase family protein [Isoptericola sp. b515]MDO8149907.1 vitamin K epoxide reductase family protein [Isoptericola sp. b408]NNU26723.1 vitamin K epoxide reductase family protein [Isoptericola sediminis]